MTQNIVPIAVALGDARLIETLGPIDGVELVHWDLKSPSPRAEWDIVVPPYLQGPELLAALEGARVGLVQSQSIGYNGVDAFLPAGVPFANAATVHETSTAELAVGLAIASQRGFPEFVRSADEQRWAPLWRQSLADRRVLIVGYGGVSKAIEARLRPFEVEITRVARTARETDGPDGLPVHVHGISELRDLLPAADVVILAIPLDDSTRGLLGAAELASLPDDALVVNVARGPVVDTDALVAELTAGRLRAALDVTDPEPLPTGHPLYTAPGLLLSPHVGGASSAMVPRMARLIRQQIELARAGEPPLNVVITG
jgi:phosphoglycerate dehydrogenase-like enzyme